MSDGRTSSTGERNRTVHKKSLQENTESEAERVRARGVRGAGVGAETGGGGV